MTSQITVEVHCLQPRWVADEKSKYRIYIDDELLTERTWIWDQNTYIKEHINAEITPIDTHTVRVDVIKCYNENLTQLILDNLIVNDISIGSYTHETRRDTVSFSIA
jgi:hypothetical protein